MYIDSHAHLTSREVYCDIGAILERAKAQRITSVINICTDQQTLENGLALAKTTPWIYNAAATTPHDVAQEGELFFPIVAACAAQKQLIAIGETGLDYHYEHSKRDIQIEFLKRYFALASEMDLPLIIHCREAFADLFALADAGYRHKRAVLHCFTGTIAEAKGVLERGWYISFSGIVTFKKSETLREVVRYAPLDKILIETDTPYLAPQSKRGQPNEPAYLPEIAALVAQVKQLQIEEIAAQTSRNANSLFKLFQ